MQNAHELDKTDCIGETFCSLLTVPYMGVIIILGLKENVY
jgi:hypothetical protein